MIETAVIAIKRICSQEDVYKRQGNGDAKDNIGNEF